jgi:hypothetical protein
VLSRRIGTTLHRTFVGETLLPFEEEFFAFAPALPALCIEIPGHLWDLP